MLSLSKDADLCGRFTLIEKLGSGGHGEVWRALDRDRGSEVALKILFPQVSRDPRILGGAAARVRRRPAHGT